MLWKRWIILGLVLTLLTVPLANLNCGCGSSSIEGPVAEAWIARYDGPSGDLDHAEAISLDGLGNVYVTGSSHVSTIIADYATIKYDSDGNELWVARYDGPSAGDDQPFALAVDGSGNVYVTGDTQVSGGPIGGDTDYATIKYDGDGNELWVKRYDGPTGGENDGARALAVDVSGNVYVTGGSTGTGTGNDYATIKYDSDGNELWVTRYDGPGHSYDRAFAIAVDIWGNVYVTGASDGSGASSGWGTMDYATIKYDSDGNELWVARYDGPARDAERAYAIAVDGAGNVYVTGYSDGGNTGADYATIKYDSNGNELWVARYDGPAGEDDIAEAIAVDESGNVYVTGNSMTIKYDSDGNAVWVSKTGGKAIAVDSSGNAYVTGESDYSAVKYDSEGNQLWAVRYGRGMACAIVVDGSGDVYVAGDSKDDIVTIKYTPK